MRIRGFVAIGLLTAFLGHRYGLSQTGNQGETVVSAGLSSSKQSSSAKTSRDRMRRDAWFLQGRAANGTNTSGLLHKAWSKRLELREDDLLKNFAQKGMKTSVGGNVWQPMGPVSVTSDPGTGGVQDYGVVSGRAISIAVDQSDSSGNTVYVGTSGGGVWKSVNATASDPASVAWTPLTDTQASLVIGAIAIKPDNSNVVLAGTGEGDSSTDSYYGQGILRSSDGGHTWISIGSANGGNGNVVPLRGIGFTSIAFSQDNPNLVVASTAGVVYPGANNFGSIRGLYYSTDAGNTWTLASATDSGSPVGGVDPASATQVIFNQFTHRFYAALRNHGVYESVDGANFSRMAVQPFTALTIASCPTAISSGTCPFYRAQFAMQPATHTMFVIAVDGQEISQGISMATDAQLVPASPAPITWSMVSDIDPTLPTVNGVPTTPSGITEGEGGVYRKLIQGRYDLWISAIQAGSSTQLFVGTRDIYRCDLGSTSNCTAGNAWVNLTKVYQTCGSSVLSPFAHVHADQHAMAISEADPNKMFFANDGGVYRALHGASGDGCGSAPNPFESLNTNLGPISEFVSFAQHPVDPAILMAGAEHTGTSATTASLGTHWQAVNGGDGGYSEIDPNAGTADDGSAVAAGQIWYSENTDVSIQRCTNGSACTQGAFGLPNLSANIENAQVGGDRGDFLTPFKLEPQSSALLFVGTCRLWRGPGAGGASWNGLNPLSPMFDYLVIGVPAPASCGGETNIRSIAAGGPIGTASANGQQYNVAKVVYVGMSSGTDANGAMTAASGHIFVTRDSTAAVPQWTDITLGSGGGGPPISDITVDPKDPTGGTALATIMGFGVPHVLKTTDFGAQWTNIAPASVFPDVPADAIVLDPNDANTIYVGTDIGMFYTSDAGQSWSVLGTGLPTVPITKIRVFSGQKLRVSTFGRGVWETALAGNSPPVQTPPPSANTQFVYNEYHDLLNRDPDYDGWVYWVNTLNGGMSWGQLVAGFMSSPEFLERDIYTASLIQTLLRRTPDYPTFLELMNFMVNGADQVQAAQQVLALADFTALYGNNLSDAAFVALIYNNILGRNPDPGGLNAWTSLLSTGAVTRAQAVVSFLNSSEFQSNKQMQARMQAACVYLALYRRTPDEGGLSFWSSLIFGGTSLAQVADGFLTSPEFYARDVNYAFTIQQYRDILDHDPNLASLRQSVYLLDTGLSRADAVVSLLNSQEAFLKGRFTAALYQTLLGRPADMGGYLAFTASLETGAPKEQIAGYFIGSAEFALRFGPLSDAQFVTRIYENVLLREPDAGGLQAFAGFLSSGAMTRTQVVVLFLTSPEYLANLAAQNRAVIGQIYVALLRRGATQSEFAAMLAQLNSGVSLTNLIDGILNSAEYKARNLPF